MSNEVEIVVRSTNRTRPGFLDAIREAELAGRIAGGLFGDGFIRDSTGRLRDAHDRFGRDIDEMSDTARRGGRRSGQHFGEGFGSILRRAFTQLIENGIGAAMSVVGDLVSTFFRRTSDAAASLATNLATGIMTAVTSGGAMTAATGGLNILIGALVVAGVVIAAMAVGLTALAPVLLLAGGAAGAMATLVAGAGVAVATLWAALSGVGDAIGAVFAPAVASGASQMSNMESNARSLAAAQRGLAAAQAGVNEAWEDATRHLRDMNAQLSRARLDEKSAALSVLEAEKALQDVRKGKHTRLEIERARLAYEQAKETLEETRTRVNDLEADTTEANEKGVAGSDQVKSALERQQAAMDALASAQEAMAQAASSGAGGVDKLAEAMEKLSPNARLFVGEFIRLKPALGDIKTLVQDRLFDGLNLSLRDLAGKWLPAAKSILGDMADDLNVFAKRFAEAFGKTSFIENIKRGAAGFGNMIERIGQSLGGLIDAFGRLAGGSVPFLERMGELIGGLIDKFAAWIKKVDESGDLAKFMKDAADTLRDVWDIGGLVFGIIGEIVKILFPSSKKQSDTLLGGVKEMLQGLKEWLEDPENQKKLKEWMEKLQEFAEKMITEVIPAVFELVDIISDWIKKTKEFKAEIDEWKDGIVGAFNAVKDAATGAKDWVVESWNGIVDWFSGLGGRIGGATAGMWDGIKNSFRGAINGIIGAWNNLSFNISGGNFMGVDIPSFRLDTPNINYLARGGIAGGLAMVGERGRELVNLPQGSTVIPNGTTEAMMAGAGSSQSGAPVLEYSGSTAGLDALFVTFLQKQLRTGALKLTVKQNRVVPA